MTKAQEMIEDIITKFSGSTFSDQEEAKGWLRLAIAGVYEAGREAAYEEMYVEFSPVAEGINRLHERLTP